MALELAIDRGLKEEIIPPEMCFDVLTQHLATLAADEGLDCDKAFEEVINTYAYRNLSRQEFDEIVNFLSTGGRVLSGYPNYHKLKLFKGRYLFYDKRLIQDHMMNIGTITSDLSIKVQYLKGPNLGSIDESFLGKLKKRRYICFCR